MTIDMAIFMREPPLALEFSVFGADGSTDGRPQWNGMTAPSQILSSHRTGSRWPLSL